MEHSRYQSDARVRRGSSRLRTCLPARLVTVRASFKVILLDISQTGARLMLRSSGFERTAIPLRTQAILDWELGDAFGTVLREAAGNYGMIFEETVSPKLLIATRDLHDNLASQGGLDYLVKEAARNFVHGRK